MDVTHMSDEIGMIERVSKVVDRYMVCRVGGDTWGIYDTQHPPEANCWAATGVKGEEYAVDLCRKFNARAAIKAMEGPPLSVIGKVARESDKRYDGKYNAYGPLEWIFNAFIDAALSEDKPK